MSIRFRARSLLVLLFLSSCGEPKAAPASPGSIFLISRGQLWRIQESGTREKLVIECERADQVTCSADGLRLAVIGAAKDHLVICFGGNLAAPTIQTDLPSRGVAVRDFHFDHQARSLALIADTGDRHMLYVASPGDRMARALTSVSGDDRAATWDPSGGKLAILATNQSERTVSGNVAQERWSASIEIVDVASGDRSRLGAPLAGALRVSWSPDGKLLAVDDLRSIFMIPVDGRPMVEVYKGTEINPAPVWSLDGGEILFGEVRDAEGGDPSEQQFAAIVLRVADRSTTRIAAEGRIDALAWDQTGRQIARIDAGTLVVSTVDPPSRRVLFEDAGPSASLIWASPR